MLYPKNTTTRNVFSLDGVWEFKLIPEGQKNQVDPAKKLTDSIPMAVPSAYNDLYPGKDFKNHVGDMVYQTSFVLNQKTLEEIVNLRFESVAHHAEVYLNGQLLGKHSGGFLPFEFPINDFAKIGNNLLTVFVNNILDYSTIPTGRYQRVEYPDGTSVPVNYPSFDFFNYAGILRPVKLYTTPKAYLKDIVIVATAAGEFEWQIEASSEQAKVVLSIYDPDHNKVAEFTELAGSEVISDVKLWDTETPNLYTAEISLDTDGTLDSYTELFGFRTVTVKPDSIYLNDKPVYLTGFGKHEDFPVNGRGFNEALNVKDIALLKWMGANSFRTSHYPYSEEMMQLCDRTGILVIDEVPAVGLNLGFTATGLLGGDTVGTWENLKTAQQHEQAIRELVARDKNHPCVIMWCVANEPASQAKGAREYFEPMFDLYRSLDAQKRPVTLVTYDEATPENCEIPELCDVICINRYYGWYTDDEDLKMAKLRLKGVLEAYRKRCPEAPIILTEYGADTVAGMHDINAGFFSEEFQVEFLKAYGEVFDELDYVAGEHVWNFADFATAANIKRVQGNKKGVFTRDRNPKAAAWFLKERWSNFTK